jgi:hypothetical protein
MGEDFMLPPLNFLVLAKNTGVIHLTNKTLNSSAYPITRGCFFQFKLNVYSFFFKQEA